MPNSADYPLTTKRVVVGQVSVCFGCCCGDVTRDKPEVPVEWLKQEWRMRGLLKNIQLSISGCRRRPLPALRLEVHSQGELSGTIAPGTLRKRGLQNPEGRAGDARRRWREVGVIQKIGERGFEADMRPIPKVEALGEARVHVDHVWTFEDDAAASKTAGIGGRQSERTSAIELRGGLAQGQVVRGRSGRHLRRRQVRIVFQIQSRRPLLDPAQQEMLDGVERDGSQPQRIVEPLAQLPATELAALRATSKTKPEGCALETETLSSKAY